MKFDPAVNGMNIDADPYRNAGWSVIVFKMLGSSSPIRKQADWDLMHCLEGQLCRVNDAPVQLCPGSSSMQA
jgi:hypothetical protein